MKQKKICELIFYIILANLSEKKRSPVETADR